MPELPEVETVVREITPEIVGKKIWKIECFNKSTFSPSVEEMEQFLPGKVIKKVRRKGKYIIIDLSEDLVLVVHLRMTGMLLFKPSKRLEKFVRGVITFSDATKLYYSDVRKFGKIWLAKQNEYEKLSGLFKLGVDPINEPFDGKILMGILNEKKGILKAKLLDQTLIAGIGNIYADEICFRIGKHPASRLEDLTGREVKKLAEAILYCLNDGIKHNGTTISDFVGTRGDSGKHQDYLQIYGRLGDNCYVCGEKILKTRVAGRGTFYCPKCQGKC